MDIPLDWLLEGGSFIEYRARVDLLGQPEDDARVMSSREAMLADPGVRSLIDELAGWPGTVISSHKSAGQSFHKLTFLADLGLKAGDPGMDVIIQQIIQYQSNEGPFQIPMNISRQYGGSGQEQGAWALCDAPLIVYALASFGLQSDPAVEKAVGYLTGLVRDNGWPCAVSKELGTWRGPGRKEDPCPFANLAMLKLLSVVPEWRDSAVCRVGADTLLDLWMNSETRHPYIFYAGNDFRKLKVPFIWYDLMHMLHILSQFPWLRGDARLQSMLDVLKGKMDTQGRFTLESVWMAWKDWEFGQKKEPSRWLTLKAWQIMRRLEG